MHTGYDDDSERQALAAQLKKRKLISRELTKKEDNLNKSIVSVLSRNEKIDKLFKSGMLLEGGVGELINEINRLVFQKTRLNVSELFLYAAFTLELLGGGIFLLYQLDTMILTEGRGITDKIFIGLFIAFSGLLLIATSIYLTVKVLQHEQNNEPPTNKFSK
jgi:hypothetical protein